MRIGLLGEISPLDTTLRDAARDRGHTLLIAPRAPDRRALSALIETIDVLVIFDDAVPRAARERARRLADQRGLLTWLVQRSGVQKWPGLWEDLLLAQGAFARAVG